MKKILRCTGLAVFLGSTGASAEVMLGAYVPGNGFSREEIAKFNQVTPKSLAFINLFSSFSHDWDHLYWNTTNIVAEGAMPLITWMPVDLDRPNANLLSEIALGQHDAYIDRWGEKLLAWAAQYPTNESPRLLIRFGHEFNGNWYPYGNSPFYFQSAWQYIHDKFELAGVNNYVEWVWSANNVSVDDHNDITTYYPGAEYVDWTSIDGYNFGSNYSWSSWESFTEIYADTYLTMVNNYPDKPILIAEIGSAEETDIPDASWGQYGDNSDGLESKEIWIADFLSQLKKTFPAVRAFSWFNTNKELDWSITQEVNTGINSFIGGTGSDYFTEEFLSASNGTATLPTLLELALTSAQTDYQYALQQFQTAQTQLNSHKLKFETAEQTVRENSRLRSEAQSTVNSSWENFFNSRSTYYQSRDEYYSAKNIFIEQRTEVDNLWAIYLVAHQNLLDSKEQRSDTYLEILPARSTFQNLQVELANANTTLADAKILTPDNSGLEQSAIDHLVSTADESLQITQEEFEKARSELNARYAAFSLITIEVNELYDTRVSSLEDYQVGANKRTSDRNIFLAAASILNVNHAQFVADRDIFYSNKSELASVNIAYVNSVDEESSSKVNYDNSLSSYNRLNTARSVAYTALVTAQHKVSMEQSQSNIGALLYSDASENGIDKQIEKKALAKIKTINSSNQEKLAKSRKPKPTSAEKLAKRQSKFKNMTSEEWSALKRQKLSVLSH